jgi:hypothetical protein
MKMNLDYDVDYRKKVSMPIRDMDDDGNIVFVVDVYGWTAKEVCVIPGGGAPFLHAVHRIGLNPDRYQAVMWDTPR